jgi:hypothetical protein
MDDFKNKNKDDLELKVLRLTKDEYDSYELPFRVQFITEADQIFVDDLRGNNDESLNLVPRITTFEQLKDVFKLDIDYSLGRDAVPSGQLYWSIIGFYVRTGVAAFIPKVLAENGQPAPPPGVFVFAHWPGAPPIDAEPNYHSNAVGGFTNAEGDVGFGYSGGAVIGPNGGVYDIWVSADPPSGSRFYSDMAIRLGWFGGTDHLTPNMIVQAVIKDDVTPPLGNAELRVFDNSDSFVGRVRLENGQGSGGRVALFVDGVERDFVEFDE